MSLSAICHSESSVSKLPENYREMVRELSHALNHYEFTFPSPLTARPELELAFHRYGINLDADFFESLEIDDSIEMWSDRLEFIFAMGSILSKTSYTIDELSEIPWSDLFSRSEMDGMRLVKKFEEALKTQKTQKGIGDWHQVTECRSPDKKQLLVKVCRITPFVSRFGVAGVVGVVKSKRLEN